MTRTMISTLATLTVTLLALQVQPVSAQNDLSHRQIEQNIWSLLDEPESTCVAVP